MKIDTMQALVLHEPGCLSLQEVPVPEPGPGEVLLRVMAATTCGTDLKAYLRGHPQIPMPGVFGHEYAGVVHAIGEGAPFQVGDEVMGVHSAPCQDCSWCQAGQENLCEHIMRTKVLGAYAEFLLIPKHIARLNLFHKPASLSNTRACLLEPLACVAHGISMLKTHITDRVLILGPGAIGLMFAAAFRAMGIPDVSLAGRNKARLDVGELFGARPLAWDDLQGDYNIVIECTGRVDVWERSLEFVRRGGQLMLFGGCPSGTSARFDTHRVHYDQISIISPFHFGTQAVRRAKDWLEDISLPFDHLISGDRELSESLGVFEDLKRGVGIKYALRP
ncbi:MAG: alcohol dehydrogenase catalytic domain-containing protein [Fimbriimonadaceae bacterium]|nr:alcohol dehydrogenase catalytic domain-containing protein [Fimbriimonadaceae bacterium]